MLILEGHSGAVLSVAYSPDSRTLASGGSDQSVRLWDLGNGTPRSVIPDAGDVVLSLAFSPDGNTLAVGTHSRITLWNLGTLEAGFWHRGDFPGSYTVVFTPDGSTAIAANYLEARIWVWDLALDDYPACLQGHRSGVLALAHAADQPLLVSGGGAPSGGELLVWDTDSFRLRTRLTEPIRVLHHGRYYPVEEGGVLSWKPDHRLYEAEAAHAGAVYSVAVSSDARLIASGGKDQVATIWERETGRVRFRLSGHRGTVVAVSFPPDDRTLLTADEGGAIRLWDVEAGQQQSSWDWKIGHLRSVVFAPDGMTAAAGGHNRVLVWDID